MRCKTAFVIFSWIWVPTLFLGQAFTSAIAAAQDSTCMPTAEQAAQLFSAGGQGPARRAPGPAAEPAPRNLTVTAIPGVVAAGGKWTKVWQEGGNSADG